MEIVPAIVAKNKNALTPYPLFEGDIVFNIMVIAGDTQFSATKYSNPSITKETHTFFYNNVHRAIKGIPRRPLIIQIVALVFKYPFFS